MKRVMSAHQPNFLPYLGFFDKMSRSDIFVIRDEVQFAERDYHHRNRIRVDGINGEGGPQFKWLTVSVEDKKAKRYLKDMVINNNVMVKDDLWNVAMVKQIEVNYQKTPFFEEYFPELKSIILYRKEKLIQLCMEVIYFLQDCFGITTEIAFASELDGYEKTFEPNQDLVGIAKATQADAYLSGSGGRNYLNLDPFKKEGIEVRFQDFKHPEYKQRYPGFLPNMASIDALFNVGGDNVHNFFVEKEPIYASNK